MCRDISDELNLFSLELQQSLSPHVLKQLAKEVGFVQRTSKYQAKDLVDLPEFLRQISQYKFPNNNQLSVHTETAVSCLNLKEVASVEISRPHLNPNPGR